VEKTKSEAVFERFLSTNGIPFRRVPTSLTKTPDYELTIDGAELVFEVKELAEDPNFAGRPVQPDRPALPLSCPWPEFPARGGHRRGCRKLVPYCIFRPKSLCTPARISQKMSLIDLNNLFIVGNENRTN
jgi:hypothetical protein